MFKFMSVAVVLLTFSANIMAQKAQEVVPPEYISTIQFRGGNQNLLPIINLGERLQISFDALNGREEDFYYKIIHCDYDWTPPYYVL